MTGDLVPRPPALPADRVVSDRTRERIEESVPDNTRRAYTRWWAIFEAWCLETGRTAMPATDETLTEFTTHLCEKPDLGAASVDQAIATVRSMHADAGFPHEPSTRGALRVLKSRRRELAEDGRRTKQAPPITIETLRVLVAACPADALAGLRDRCVLVLGFTLFARRSEVAALNIADVSFADDGLDVVIRKSKTDQEAKGVTVFIPAGERTDTNPVRVVRAWLDALAKRGITTGRLLRAVDRNGNPRASLSADAVNGIVRRAAERAKLERAAEFTAHSLRAGGATAAYRAGAPVSTIAAHGRWSPTSPTVHKYIRAVDARRDNALSGVEL